MVSVDRHGNDFWKDWTSVRPAACMKHQFTVTSQTWGGDPQQPERRPVAQMKYDAFMTLAYYRELKNWKYTSWYFSHLLLHTPLVPSIVPLDQS